jgi:hypothetical protein
MAYPNDCGYCRGELDADGHCTECNGFGGPLGTTRHECEEVCGYCKGHLYRIDPDPERPGYFKATPCACGCNGFGG